MMIRLAFALFFTIVSAWTYFKKIRPNLERENNSHGSIFFEFNLFYDCIAYWKKSTKKIRNWATFLFLMTAIIMILIMSTWVEL